MSIQDKENIGWMTLAVLLADVGLVHHFVNNPQLPWSERALLDFIWICGISAAELVVVLIGIGIWKLAQWYVGPKPNVIYDSCKSCRKMTT